MAKSKKTKVAIEPILKLSSTKKQRVKACEWCFQFDDDDPIVFASSKQPYLESYVSFKLTDNLTSNLSFFDNKTGKKIKIFTREKK